VHFVLIGLVPCVLSASRPCNISECHSPAYLNHNFLSLLSLCAHRFPEGGDNASQGFDDDSTGDELWQTQAVTSPLSPTRKELNFDPKSTAAYPNNSTAKKAKEKEAAAAEEAAQKAAAEKAEKEAQAKKAALEAEETAAAMRVLAASSSPGSLADRQAALDAAAERQAERRAAEQEKLDAALSSEDARAAAREKAAAEKREADKASRQAARAKERAAEAKGASDRLQRAKAEVMAKVRFGANLSAANAAASSAAAADEDEECTVAFDVSLFDQSVERFGVDQRLKFKKATAAALSVQARCVLLESVRAGSCIVVTRVEELPNADAARAVAAIVRDKESGLVAALAESGLGRCSVTAPVVTVPEPVNVPDPAAEVEATQDEVPAASTSNTAGDTDGTSVPRPPSPRGRSQSPKARAVSPSQAAKRPPSPVRRGWGELAAKGIGNNTSTTAGAGAGATSDAAPSAMEEPHPTDVASPPPPPAARGGGRLFEPGAGLPPPKAPPGAVATESTSPWVTQSGLPSPTKKSKASSADKRGTSFEEDQPYEVSRFFISCCLKTRFSPHWLLLCSTILINCASSNTLSNIVLCCQVNINDDDDDQFDDDNDANSARKLRSASGSRRIVSREGVSNMTIPEDEEVAPPMSPYEVERSYQVPQELGGGHPFEVGQLALALFDDATTWWPCMVMAATDLGDDVAQAAALKAADDNHESRDLDQEEGGMLSPLQAAAAVRARWTYELEYFDGDRRVDVPATEVEPMPAAEAAKHLEALAAAAEQDDLDAAAREAESEAKAAREALEEAQNKSKGKGGKGKGKGKGGGGSSGRNPIGRGEGPRRRARQERATSSDAVTAGGDDDDENDLLSSGASVLSAGRVPSEESMAPTPAKGLSSVVDDYEQLPVEADARLLGQGSVPTTQRLQELMAAASADDPVAPAAGAAGGEESGGKGLTLEALTAKKSNATLEREAAEIARQERLEARAAAEARESAELAARKAKRAEERALMAERFRRAEEIAEKRKQEDDQKRQSAVNDEKAAAAAARDAEDANLPASVRREQEKARAESLAKSAASRLEEKMRADRLAAKHARELAAKKEKEEAEAKERALEEERQVAAEAAAARAEQEAEEERLRLELEAKEQREREEAARRQRQEEEAAAAAAAAAEEEEQRRRAEEEEKALLVEKQREEEEEEAAAAAAAALAEQEQQLKEAAAAAAAAAREALLTKQREEDAANAARQQQGEDESEENVDAELEIAAAREEEVALEEEPECEPSTQDFAPIHQHLHQASLNTHDASVHRSLTPDSERSSLTPDRHGLSADRRASTSPSHVSSLLDDYNSTLSAVTEDPYSSTMPPAASTFAAKTGTTVEASTLRRAFPAGAETLAAATARGTTANATTATHTGENDNSETYAEPPSSETVAAATEQSAETDQNDESSSAMASQSVDVPSSSDLLPVMSMASPDGNTQAVEDSTSATIESYVEEPSAAGVAASADLSHTASADETNGQALETDTSAAPPAAPLSLEPSSHGSDNDRSAPPAASGVSASSAEPASSSASSGHGRPPLLPTPSKAPSASSAATAPYSAGRAPSVDRIQSASLSLGRPHSRTPQRASQSPGRLAYANNANLSPEAAAEAAAVDPVAQAMLAYRRLSARSPAVVRRSSDDLVAPYSNHPDRTPSTGRSRSVGAGSHMNPEIIFTADPRRRGEPMPSPGMRDDESNHDGVSRNLYPATTPSSSIARSLSAPRAGGPSTSPVPEDPAAEAAAAAALNEEDGDDDSSSHPPGHDNAIALPPGWSAVATDDGATYYWNSTTNEVTWDMPGEEAAAARKAAKEAKKAAKAAAKAEKKRKQEQQEQASTAQPLEEPTSPQEASPSESFRQPRTRQTTQRESPPGSDEDDEGEEERGNSAAMQRIAEVEDESMAEVSQAISPPASPGQTAAAARATATVTAAAASPSSRLEDNSEEVSARLELETSQDHSQLSGAPNPLEDTYSMSTDVPPVGEEDTAPYEEEASEQWDPQGSSTVAEHGISVRHSPVDDYEGSSDDAANDADARAVEEEEHGVDVTGQSLEVHADWEPNERPPPLSATSQPSQTSEEPMSPLGYEDLASEHYSEGVYERREVGGPEEIDGEGEYEGEYDDEEGYLDGIEGEDFSEGPYMDDGDEESQIALSTVDEGDEDYSQAGSIDSRDPRGGGSRGSSAAGDADLQMDGSGGEGGAVGEDGELLDEDARMAADQMVDFLAHAGLEEFVDVFMHFGFASVEDLLNPDLV